MQKKFSFAVLILLAMFGLVAMPVVFENARAKTSVLDLKRDPPKLKLEDPLPRNLFVELSKAINPAVVSITTTQNVRMMRGRMADPFQQFFEDFGMGQRRRGYPPGRGGGGEERVQTGLGTGFIISEDGLIVTNNHVVASGDGIVVSVGPDTTKETYDAQIIGRDQRSDLALIKINAKKPLPVVAMGSSKDLQVGEWVAAFGNPYGHTHTLTVGVVSAIGREVKELNRFPFIQTDAIIHPGNSGGPLVNSQGLVVGVNSAVDARGPGIGFAIPIDNARAVIAQLEKNGRIQRAYLGVKMQPVDPDMAESLGRKKLEGVVAVFVEPGSPANKAGLREYDIITEFNGKAITQPGDLVDAVADGGIGEKRKLKILRLEDRGKAKELTMDVVLGEAPDERNTKPRVGQRESGSIKAPHGLGFSVTDYSEAKAQELNLPPSAFSGPIITDVAGNSEATRSGLRPGDMIIDVNRQPSPSARDVVRLLKQGKNTIRIVRGDTMAIVPLGR